MNGEAKSGSLASLGMTCSGDLWMSAKTVMDWGEAEVKNSTDPLTEASWSLCHLRASVADCDWGEADEVKSGHDISCPYERRKGLC